MTRQTVGQALAEADFSAVVDSFTNAGCKVCQPAQGIIQIYPPAPEPPARLPRLRLLLSVGIHGDETAPIEMVAQLLAALANEPEALQVDLMIVVGNLAAIARNRRYIDADLNRLFVPAIPDVTGTADRGELAASSEAERADAIMCASATFFAAKGGEKWHLDLHTAIRKSHYPRFALVPGVIRSQARHVLAAWLGGADIGAIIVNTKAAPTYSAYTASQFGATSCTAELGQIGILGSNDMTQFAVTSAAIDLMLRSGETLAFRNRLPQVFHVAQELIKRSDGFALNFDKSTPNFTEFAPGTVIASDGEESYRVGQVAEFVVFPNPDVRIGQRAGLMVVRRT